MKSAFRPDHKSILRWLLGVVFIWAALSKLTDPDAFYSNLVAYQFRFPETVNSLITRVLPWVELSCGFLLLLRLCQRPVLWCTISLMAVFTIATGQAWARGLQIYCGCLKLDFLGPIIGPATASFFQSVPIAFFRALLLLIAAIYLLRTHSVPRAKSAPSPQD